ncbi:septal ring lytic transglycosylase RlpA family protein [Croceicoccus mobilis]|uniref:Endolytic peptidoglycan transglycosylase RlpA n=1 Tax=Croceicoccus mobilis TaxID=1703339 RepID=A0A917DYG5_9SPHN|nr:septal ring lytic transglycosylase RlpA family protein [Croceicoccus mobilis]GGD83556.1 hypothetical protein GCM10010990_37090 [Croceicoccus mobilis]
MKNRISIRLRPARRLAFFGVASLVAVPLTGALAGPEAADSVEISQNLLDDGENAEAVDLIPTSDENAMQITAKQVIPDAEPETLAEIIGHGEASWYGKRFAGRPTANGETFNPGELTAAHKTLPFGSRVRVTSRRTGKSVVVRINDRGPYHGNRVIDLSEAAAREIGIKSRGKGNVELALLTD